MMSMVERVARAAYEKFIEDVRDLEPSWEDLPQSHRDRMIDSQRAAIEEMREPTDAITCAIADASPSYTMKDTRIRIWEAAIDAALNEQVAG